MVAWVLAARGRPTVGTDMYLEEVDMTVVSGPGLNPGVRSNSAHRPWLMSLSRWVL